ncbi:MAG TPA: nodulation protein NfeD [Pseudomonadales bacterium]|nr:nodulation protein NfeD [Pseudomonadales bacterium]
MKPGRRLLRAFRSIASLPGRTRPSRRRLPYLALLTLSLPGAIVLAADTRPDASDTGRPEVRVIALEGAVGPASADWIIRNLQEARDAAAELLVIRMDTPGGLDAAMRDIIKAILDSDVPVATFVTPSGSRAASAGTYILYASHIAAMAPATNLGAATPVSIGGGGGPLPMPGTSPRPGEPQEPEGADEARDGSDAPGAGAPVPATAMERKAINDAVAYIRGLAELRGRNADWAEAAVRSAASLSAREALELGVVDLVVADLGALLTAVDGREVVLARGARTLATRDARITHVAPDWRSRFLATITDPNVAYILLMIGIYGLILEFYSPGLGIAGVTGAICLLIGAYALQMLPVNYVGLALIAVGIALMVLEAFTPSFGAFGVGGVIAFALGSVLLIDSDVPAYRISLPVIGAFVAASAGLCIFVIGAALRARAERVVSGREAILGAEAVALEDFRGDGRVRLQGEVWRARSEQPVVRGEALRVTDLDGLVVQVAPPRAEDD